MFEYKIARCNYTVEALEETLSQEAEDRWEHYDSTVYDSDFREIVLYFRRRKSTKTLKNKP